VLVFIPQCNVVVGNVLVLVLKGKLECTSLPSQWNIIVGNVFVLVQQGKLAFLHDVVLLEMHLCWC
jgi:hypothetical protein